MWKNEYFQTAITILIIVIAVFGFWFGLRFALNTKIFPALAVTSGSMCIPYDGACNGWSHPFARTFHTGDMVIIQGVDAKELNANYPNSDIIVFQRPDLAEDNPAGKIVHRIVSEVEVNGKLYFYTKGDGNGAPDVWPNPANTAVDYWQPAQTDSSSTYNGAVSADYIYGKVVMRVPWIGWVSILAQQYFLLPLIIVIIIILIVAEFVLPIIKERKTVPPPPAETQPPA
jgi:signal peptidase I